MADRQYLIDSNSIDNLRAECIRLIKDLRLVSSAIRSDRSETALTLASELLAKRAKGFEQTVEFTFPRVEDPLV